MKYHLHHSVNFEIKVIQLCLNKQHYVYLCNQSIFRPASAAWSFVLMQQQDSGRVDNTGVVYNIAVSN